MFIILLLIVAVDGVQHRLDTGDGCHDKQPDIAILRTLGASPAGS